MPDAVQRQAIRATVSEITADRTATGLRIALLERPGPVVSLRLAVQSGARDDRIAGTSHMLEHLLFRCAEGAEARQSIERLGGEIGASTSREHLAIDVVVMPDDLEAALDALARIVRARPRSTDLERERSVIVRETAHESEEQRRIWQLQSEALFGDDHPLARPIIGSAASVQAIAMGDLRPAAARLCAPCCALAVVGPVDRDRLLRAARDVVPAGDGTMPFPFSHPLPLPGRRHEERRSGLLHLAVGWRFDGSGDPRLAALRLAEIILAHGSGSRLYEHLRTRRRLAYRVSTVLVPYSDAGHLSAVTSCAPGDARRAETALVGELERLAARGPSWNELDAARRQHAGMSARASESSRRLASTLATQLLWDRVESVAAVEASMASVTPTQVRSACREIIRTGHAVASIGRSLDEPSTST